MTTHAKVLYTKANMDLKKPATILVILGVTGDLAAKKILPALFNLHSKNALPEQFKIVEFGRKPYTSETFPSYIIETVRKRLPLSDPEALASFAAKVDYVQGTFETARSYLTLAKHLHKQEHEWQAHAYTTQGSYRYLQALDSLLVSRQVTA